MRRVYEPGSSKILVQKGNGFLELVIIKFYQHGKNIRTKFRDQQSRVVVVANDAKVWADGELIGECIGYTNEPSHDWRRNRAGLSGCRKCGTPRTETQEECRR